MTGHGRTRIRDVHDAADVVLRPAYALLRRTFARHERVTFADWKATLRERDAGVWTDTAWHLLVAERGGEVVGLVTGTYLGNVNVGVIGYLAIAEGARAGGLGTRLRARLLRAFEHDAITLAARPLLGIVGEVSEANPWLRTLARRPGVLVLDVAYFQPRLYPEDRPSPFRLYIEFWGRHQDSLPVAEVRQLLYAIWRRGYRISRPLERPAFRRMLRSLQGRRRVGAYHPPPLPRP